MPFLAAAREPKWRAFLLASWPPVEERRKKWIKKVNFFHQASNLLCPTKGECSISLARPLASQTIVLSIHSSDSSADETFELDEPEVAAGDRWALEEARTS